ncbi:similar to Saccharomyces cerevisiae YDR489W SLD5 Subunit of the GINS complex [Maudiozyma barnettii]|uniref:DNA replication complex GINS protein SLD5 n=1 Tax=Maudiozyma barnettii TaxID=61262 RepID=A0A8H2VDQ8_9SACH|nr:DNA replication protein SLD5 [Kazachstania barnettii]CAB4253600.1 similar to Saccharomyces cerevisiae YDR489W SLD5 Subunit of the GINS complex [Kazachstania barnettii]CAD1781274.1 similar to Saccharomyces cerevisiae YDR489W SLD5 Subunit of the GINS complex [Kazachstania barnettii]
MDVDIEDILAELNTDSTAVDYSGNPLSDGISTNASTLYNNTSSSFPIADGKHATPSDKLNHIRSNTSPSISAEHDYSSFITLWRNERCAPELLPYPHHLMTRMIMRIQDQLERLEIISMDFMGQSSTTTTTTTNKPVNNNNMLPLLCMEAELERIKFVIRSYIRCRLSKIDKFSLYLRQINEQREEDHDDQDNDSLMPLEHILSKDEMVYYQRHSEMILKLFNETTLKHLPPELQAINDTTGTISMIDEPDWNKFVFIKVTGPTDKSFNNDPLLRNGSNGKYFYEVIIPELEEDVELFIGSIYVMRYSVIKNLLLDGKVILI